MSLLYYLGIKLYYFLALVFSLFNDKARLFVQGRKGLLKKLEKEIDPRERIFWFHCASLGEFEQGRPLIEEIKSRHPGIRILLTFFSPSGYEIRKSYQWADWITYLPIDTPRNARRFLEMVRPEKVFFIKYEYWYFYLREIKRRNIPVYLVSAIFRENQFFFKSYGRWFRKILFYFDHIFVQNNSSQKLLAYYRIQHVTVTGDTRFDRVKQIAEKARPISLIEQFRDGHFLIVAGSTWPRDEAILIRYFQNISGSVKLIIAPHEVHSGRIKSLMEKFPEGQALKFSEAGESNITEFFVLIIDSIGMLSSLYRYGDLAYVGGGFGKGIHNILEPATFGLPVVFGPHHEKFKEAVDLKNMGGGFSVDSYTSFSELMDAFLDDREQVRQTGRISRQYVEDRAGGTSRILQHILDE
ncbi:MAG: 3-deoxy-D-manno-octulosonic acid transferase [Bacteroidales bacterium]|nr:3-deoxy-D-manno-octulosonic acid transferase [Bacteroidales bacterium]